jgi:hypothetical protein
MKQVRVLHYMTMMGWDFRGVRINLLSCLLAWDESRGKTGGRIVNSSQRWFI